MRITFVDPSQQAYTPDTPYERALGGTQSAAAYLSAALAARGHQVALLNRRSVKEPVRGVACLGRGAGAIAWMKDSDVVISLTRVIGKSLRDAGVTKPTVLWQHADIDAAGAPSTDLNDPDQRQGLRGVVYVSDYQRDRFRRRDGPDGPVIRNAISPLAERRPLAPSFLERGDAPRLIYASYPTRGLDALLMAMPTLRRSLPGATLDVFSDAGIYQGEHGPLRHVHDPFLNLAEDLPGVTSHGSVSQTRLSQAFGEADLFLYPTLFTETSCIVMMEALAAGAIVAASDLGALRETAAGYGAFFTPPKSVASLASGPCATALAQVEQARADPAAFHARRESQARHFRETHTWANRASEWERWLEEII